ncbi:ABC transporter permease [Sciscionella sediminilitoris]|uniref:ABC transporter permease n=1 Tax=Sciscionella sediminilitoris TaxID=1445613 RepID=UPI0004DFA41F|nr:ABC transporter permease [Sciscionella sp. SE31]
MTATRTEPDPQALEETIGAALAAGERPGRPGAVHTSLTFGWRALLRIKHIPEQLFDVTIFPVMMTLMFSFLFGGALAGSVHDYLQFFIPGILVQSVIMITMYTGMALRTDIERGVFDRIRSLPIWRPSALVGALLGDAVRFTVASAIVVGLGLALGFRPAGGVGGVLLGVAILLLFSFSLAWLWTLLGFVLRTTNAVMGVSMMIMMPLTFGSNIFVNPATMPGWLEAFVRVNPVSHLTDSVRAAMTAGPVWPAAGIVLIECAVLLAVFGPLTMRRFNRQT